MKRIALLAAVVALVLAEERPEHNKRGVAKTSPLNSIPSNGHQKPEQLTYTYQQPGGVTQAPLYPLPPPSFSKDQQQPVTHQPTFSFLPHQSQMVPYPVIAQQFAQPKYQLVAMRSPNGHMHLTLIPQSLIFNPQSFASPAYLQIQNPYHAGAQTNTQAPVPSTQSTHTTQYTPQPTAQVQYVPQYNFQNPILSQPSYLFGQPAPQLYNNYLAPQQNLMYSPAVQQLLNYYQSNPQAKHQLLYGNYQQDHTNSFQAPANGVEYEKSNPAPAQQSPKNGNDLKLNTNEYLQSPAESQFRPVPSYGSRGHATYKTT